VLEKIKKFIIKNKRIILVIASIMIFIIIALLLIFKLFINNKYYYSESKVANDSKEALNTLYQAYEKSKATFKVYGDVTDKVNPSMKITCDGKSTIANLSDEPITVGNHCIITLIPMWDSGGYLNAYITTPDGSLATLSSYDNPEVQLNAYKNETRVVVKSGTLYTRVGKQTKNSKFNIQIGNLILTSNGGEETSASANILDSKSAFDLLYGSYAVNGDRYYDKIETDTIVGIASFQVIKGATKIYQRDDMRIIGGEGHKHYIFFGQGTPNETIYFAENGAEEFSVYYELDQEIEDKLIAEQEKLNKNKELDFIGIINHDEDNNQSDIDKIMDKYHDYYTNKKNNENAETEENEEEENNNMTNKGACEIYTELSGYNPTGICWCRNDFHISSGSLAEISDKGYNFSTDDFIYCYTFTSDSYVEGYILKECALNLGWPGTYSNEGGYSCQ
jgi:hypothetical protein